MRPTVTTESVKGKKNALRSHVLSATPRLSAMARASGMASTGRVLATV